MQNDGDIVEKGKMIARGIRLTRLSLPKLPGKIEFQGVIEGVTYRVEADESTGLREMIIIESKDKTKVPSAHIIDEDGEPDSYIQLPCRRPLSC